MNFNLTEENVMFRDLARQFAEKEVASRAEGIDLAGVFPQHIFDKMAEIGFTGIGTPEEYGGSGGDEVDKVLVVEELAKKCATTAGTLSIHLAFGYLIS